MNNQLFGRKSREDQIQTKFLLKLMKFDNELFQCVFYTVQYDIGKNEAGCVDKC